MTLALDIQKNGYCTLGSGEFHNSGMPTFFLLSGQDLSEKKENSVLIGHEYLNRTNHPVDLFICFKRSRLGQRQYGFSILGDLLN